MVEISIALGITRKVSLIINTFKDSTRHNYYFNVISYNNYNNYASMYNCIELKNNLSIAAPAALLL